MGSELVGQGAAARPLARCAAGYLQQACFTWQQTRSGLQQMYPVFAAAANVAAPRVRVATTAAIRIVAFFFIVRYLRF